MTLTDLYEYHGHDSPSNGGEVAECGALQAVVTAANVDGLGRHLIFGVESDALRAVARHCDAARHGHLRQLRLVEPVAERVHTATGVLGRG